MTEREQLEQAIAALEAQRALLGDAVVNAALAPMREKLATLTAAQTPTPASAPRETEQRKQVTVLFSDVSGFTAMSETMDPEEVSATMNDLWIRLDSAIVNRGGRIDKHIGDAVMALFGSPTAHEDDPERAIRAALDMQQEIQTFHVGPDGQPWLRMRVGINTGLVLLGTIGTTGEYTAMGDTVNLASRLEHAAPVGGILISHDTYRHVRGVFDVLPQAPLSVKGKSQPIQVYVVRAAKPKAFRVTTRGVEGMETRTIGREAELRQMQAAFIAACDQQQSHLVSVVAEAGTGKSRLLYEFHNWLELLPTPTRLFRGRATLEMSKVPFSLIRDTLIARFGIQDTDRASTAREKLERGFVELVGDRYSEALVWAHFIGHLSGFDFSGSPHVQGILSDARQIRDLAYYYLTQFVAALTDERPVVVLLEDIHWADEGSLDLINHLLHTRPDLPLIVVGLTRPALFEERPQWGEGPMAHVRLDLKPLAADDSRQLVAEILRKVPEVPPGLVDLIVTRAEGSPFYVEELIKVLIDDEVIVTGEDEWRVAMDRLAEVRVPATLTGILQARLDSLPGSERETLQQAAVVGRVFWDSVLKRLQGRAAVPMATSEQLTSLNKKELIFRREESSVVDAQEYIFKHAILHDVTYESVLKRLRRGYHAQVAEGLIELVGERAGEYAGRVAEHFERAEDWARAAEWYGRAGRQARATFVPQAAIDYFQKAITSWKQAPGAEPLPVSQQIGVYAGLGDTLLVQARYREALGAYTAMLGLAEQAGDVPAQSRAWQGLAQAYGDLGDSRAALDGAVRAEALARSIGARTELGLATFMKGRALLRHGDPAGALEAGAEIVELATAAEDHRLRASGQNLLGAVHYAQGRYAEAERCWQDALQVFQASGDRHRTMQLLNNLGVLAVGRGDDALALRRYEEALRIAREVGHREGETMYLSNLAEVKVTLGEYEAAEADLRQVIRATEGARLAGVSDSYRCLAEACLGQGKLDEAVAAGQRALSVAQESDEQQYIIAAWRVLGQAASRLSAPVSIETKASGETRPYSAADCFAESLHLCTDTGMEGERARTLREWAKFELASGHRDHGLARWNEARELFAQLGVESEVKRMETLPRLH